MREDSWVTVALSDGDCWQALVLSKSLRRTFTSKKITIAISENVSKHLKVFLQNEFDLVLRFDTSELKKFEGSKEDLLKSAKEWCWNIKIWRKCVYLDPNTFAVTNADEIFEKDEFLTSKEQVTSDESTPFVFLYQNTANKNDNNNCISKTKSKKILNKKCTNLRLVDSKYVGIFDELDSTERTVLPNLIKYNGLPWKTEFKSINQELIKNLPGKWISTFIHEIYSVASNEQDETLRELLLTSIAAHELPTSIGSIEENESSKNGQNFDLGELSDSIAIIGLSCRFPGANNAEEYWNLLLNSVDPIRKFPSERPSRSSDNYDSEFEAGFLKCSVDEFDAKFFGISPREAPFVDPQQRILLEVIWESLENSNINPLSLKESNTGVFMGVWQQDYDRMLPNNGLSANDFHHRYLGNAFSATASRISYFLGLFGPNYSIESGCSSSSSGIHLACQSLLRQETNLAISSGVNLVLNVINPLSGDDKNAVVLSKDYRCKTFDESADGFVRAEGCGAIVLKRYVDALRDGDNVLALIRGTALNNDGPGTSFGTPNARAQERVFREALKNAGVRADEVSYVEAHGTGTMVGDPTEMYAISQVYSSEGRAPIFISSVKTNIGHAESCAGLAGLIKVILSMKNSTIPPHLHLKNLNPRINLDAIPAIIPTSPTPWKTDKKIGAVSSFSMSGTNVHMIVQEAPKISPNTKKYCKRPEVVVVSAKSDEALTDLLASYLKYMKENPDVSLTQFSNSTNRGRAALSIRAAIVAEDREQFISKLEKKDYATGKLSRTSKNKIGFLFTGQGSQYIGMCHNIYQNIPAFKNSFNYIEKLFKKEVNYSLSEVLWEKENLLQSTNCLQPAIFCLQYCLGQTWRSFGVEADYVLGQSFGEYSAAVYAGVLSVEEGFKLVVERSKLVKTLPQDGAMCAIMSSISNVNLYLKAFSEGRKTQDIDIAAVNSEEEVVISGNESAIKDFSQFCANNRIKFQIISSPYAYHSKAMDPILSNFAQVASTVQINPLKCQYISGTLAREMEKEDFSPEYWVRHLRDTVRFSDAVKLLWTDCKNFIEIGPQPVLLSLAMANLCNPSDGIFCPSLRRNEEDWVIFFNALAKQFTSGTNINWELWFKNERKEVILPTYPFQRQKYWYSGEEGEVNGPLFNTKLLHPLLGRQMPSPITDQIFSQTLKIKELSYIKDHKVGERIIVPAAAYLETILSAGREVLQGGGLKISYTVENLTVEAALELDKTYHIQTVVASSHSEDGISYKIAIHKQISSDEADKWKRHASGVFSPSTKAKEPSLLKIDSLKDKLELKESLDSAYAKIAAIGIQFGPQFQSISKAWIGKNELLAEILLPLGSDDYICHPIVLDAMIQTYAFRFALTSHANNSIELQLPIGIKKFTWFSNELSQNLYAHTIWSNDNENGKVVLYNENGVTLGVMEGLELLKTSVDSFIRALNSEKMQLPAFHEEIWRPTMGTTRSRVNMSLVESINSGPLTNECVNEVLELEKYQLQGFEAIIRLFFNFVVRGINECDWVWPKVGEILKITDWIHSAPIHLQNTRLLQCFCLEFMKYGYLSPLENENYKVLKDLPSLSSLEKIINEDFEIANRELRDDEAILRYTKRCGSLFTSLLQGKISPIAYMFPEDPNEVGAIRFYNEGKWYKHASYICIALFIDSVMPLYKNGGSGVLRILEVGAGSGKSAIQLIEKLNEFGIKFQYTFTDISPLLVADAQKKIKGINFGVLNIEEDPLNQGFSPDEYDVVLAMQVLHATSNLNTSLKNIRTLLRPHGTLILSEQFVPTTLINFSFGMLDGWWKFSDFRKNSPLLDSTSWKKCLKEADFDRTQSKEILYNMAGAVIGRKSEISMQKSLPQKYWVFVSDKSDLSKILENKFSSVNRGVLTVSLSKDYDFKRESESKFIVNYEDKASFLQFFSSVSHLEIEGVLILNSLINLTVNESQEEEHKKISGGLLYFCQALVDKFHNSKLKPNIFMITRGVHYLGDSSPGNPNCGTTWGMLKSFHNELPEFSITLIDADQDEINPEREGVEIFNRFWQKEKEMFLALREDKIFVTRVVGKDNKKACINLPNTDRFRLTNPESGSFGDIEVAPAAKTDVKEGQVEISILATSLNFRDLFLILKPEGFELPSYMSKEVGMDIAGIVTQLGPNAARFKVGDEVFGFTNSGGLASHVVVSEREIMKKPSEMTFAAASTIPCAFLTVFYSLIECAQLKRNDKILIHVATGGVGLAAIQIAQHIGAEIYATAGSRRKRTYLKSLGINNIYHSRNTDYGDQILNDTKGEGVSVVLNSLTGPNFKEATLKACGKKARFVEIGKVNIWAEEEVRVLRPDVAYFIVDLAIMAYNSVDELAKYVEGVNKEIQAGVYKGLPHETFPLDLARDAFYHFQEAKHIGKIVITIPKPSISPEGKFFLHTELFNSQSTYLITGGLGGIGMEVTKWMTKVGAKNIVLVGRNAPNERAEELIKSLNSAGFNIVVLQTDVICYEKCKELLINIKDMGLPPLRGIMHAAGVISDSLIQNMSWEKYESTFGPKVRGAWNLHRLTLKYELEFFAMFSSASAVVGLPGQSNHSGANRYLDSFANYRISLGLPAYTINFGPWSDVGAAAHIKLGQEGALGIKAFTPKQGIAGIEKVFRERIPQSMILDVVDWNVLKEFIRLGHFLDEMKSEKAVGSGITEEYSKLVDEVKNAAPEERQEKIENFLELILKQTLRIPDNEKIDKDQNFTELGVDSLMAMEMRNRLQGMLGQKTLTVSALQENRTLRSLSTHMANLMNSEGEEEIDLSKIILEDSILPQSIKIPSKGPLKPSEFKNILLTGATGHLGSHFIPELLKAKSDITVFCLVRAKNDEEAHDRLLSSLKSNNIKVSDIKRIVAIAADLRAENLGLQGEEYSKLSTKIDSVIHCAIKSNHLDGYGDGGENSMRHHNVFGTLNILKFCANERTKPILYASSLLSVTKASRDGILSEEYPESDELGTDIKSGYSLSKFICEKLMNEASKVGIPSTVIRYASIFGNSKTGYMPSGYNHAWSILISCIRVRSFPSFDQNGIPIMAVDTAANISSQIWLSDKSQTGVYNLTNDSVVSESDIQSAFSAFGINGEFLPFSEWRDLVFEEIDSNALGPVRFLYEDDKEKSPRYLSFHPLASTFPSLEINKLSEKVVRNLPDIKKHLVPAKELLERHLDYYFKSISNGSK